jgi:cytochrome c oxidase subunit 4
MSTEATPHGEHDPHASAVRTYLIIFVTLALLTLLTVGVAYMKLPHAAGVVIALLIAAAKVYLIASFFMHLRSEGRLINVSLGICLALVLILVVFVLPDIGLHEIEAIQHEKHQHHVHLGDGPPPAEDAHGGGH